MGFSGISPWSLLLILVIVLVLFGTKRLRNAGGDLGSAIKNFKKSMSDAKTEASGATETKQVDNKDSNIVDSEATVKKDKVS
ncbi:MAG: twin-arginine translocase TatA/TatE family subunit [Thiotrichaceae bacterium]|nr:twin-arginine translocase TatA/TatE family subunit [Thiotrichaceae bacterium]